MRRLLRRISSKATSIKKGQYVVIDQDELRALAPQTSTEIEVVEFVRFEEIDPVYLETSYYVVPDENAEKAYALLLETKHEVSEKSDSKHSRC